MPTKLVFASPVSASDFHAVIADAARALGRERPPRCTLSGSSVTEVVVYSLNRGILNPIVKHFGCSTEKLPLEAKDSLYQLGNERRYKEFLAAEANLLKTGDAPVLLRISGSMASSFNTETNTEFLRRVFSKIPIYPGSNVSLYVKNLVLSDLRALATDRQLTDVSGRPLARLRVSPNRVSLSPAKVYSHIRVRFTHIHITIAARDVPAAYAFLNDSSSFQGVPFISFMNASYFQRTQRRERISSGVNPINKFGSVKEKRSYTGQPSRDSRISLVVELKSDQKSLHGRSAATVRKHPGPIITVHRIAHHEPQVEIKISHIPKNISLEDIIMSFHDQGSSTFPQAVSASKRTGNKLLCTPSNATIIEDALNSVEIDGQKIRMFRRDIS